MAAPARSLQRRRLGVRVLGTVQGVGFRPHVYRLAQELRLAGWVRNDERGVRLEVEGDGADVEGFLERLASEAPPLAAPAAIDAADLTPTGEREFRILDSESRGEPVAMVSADTATCAECLVELADPADRRYRYPFINCTNCGPRFTIVTGVPYDRAATTMAGFEMCTLCSAEYDDPGDRRFHAQPNACPACGPRAWLAGRDGAPLAAAAGDPVEAATRMLGDGAILAVKGIGGFHLACLAGDERAVRRLRQAKHREDRPFALMAPSLEAAASLVELTPAEQALLTGRQRPIVIARRRAQAAVAASVAPGSPDLGVMLPYSPLHHLLLAGTGEALVMTSGNVSDEPIAYEDLDALARLAGIADAFLLHDRPIHVRTDDSVLRSLAPSLRAAPLLIRRSRGYVPEGLPLPLEAARPILACGAELKNTFCLAKGDRAWVGHHIGDLKNYETLNSFATGISHFRRLFAVDAEVIAHDLHPDYLSTRYALERPGVERVPVQHHHAHLAACLAEHGEGAGAAAIGAIFDGSGHGPDGTVWGGELLFGDLAAYERVGMLFAVGLPGGDAAVREPWRMAAAWLAAALDERTPEPPRALRAQVTATDWDAVCSLLAAGVNSPRTSSVGRLFDAVAALCGLRARVSYEGQAAAELESLCDRDERVAYPMPLRAGGAAEPETVIDARATVRALLGDLQRGVAAERVAARFHNALASATARACERAAEARGVGRVVLAGGVFQNRLLLERTARLLSTSGIAVLIPQRLPPNDGGVSYGQAAVAAARMGAAG